MPSVPPDASPKTRERAPPSWPAQLIPWIIALGILGFVLSRIPHETVWAAVSQVSPVRLGALVILFVAVLLLVDSLVLWIAFRAALPKSAMPYGSLMVIRGASYLLSQVSYAAGQGSLVYFLWQRHRIPIAAAAGATLLTNGALLIVMALAVAMGLLAGAVPERPELRMVAITVFFALPAYLAVIAWKPGLLVRRRLLEPLFRAGARGSARVAGARALHLAVLISGHIIAMRLFGVDVPIAVALAGLPVMFLVAALPISPSGLGTTQAAAITLFGSFAPGDSEAARHAVVLAYSLSFQVTATLVTLLVGLVCLRKLGGGLPGSSAAPDASI